MIPLLSRLFPARRLRRELAQALAQNRCQQENVGTGLRMVEELREALKRFGVHRGPCAAFPATSEEQIERDCNCGLTATLHGDARSAP